MFLAVAFLTRIPAPRWVQFDPAQLARSAPWFPAVGVLVGAGAAAAFTIAGRLWPPLVAAALSTGATAWLTGALHEDGLADAADGLGGGRDRDRVLEIMRDSRIGTYGGVALILVIATKLAALAAMGPGQAVRALIAAHVLGRWTSLPLLRSLPYAREDEGTARPFVGGISVTGLSLGTAATAALVLVALGYRGAAASAIAVLLTWGAGRYFRRRIGGITGDCLGAVNQVVELATYLVVLV